MQASDSIDASLRSLAVEVLPAASPARLASGAGSRATASASSGMRRTLAEALSGQPSLAKASVAAGALRDLTAA